MVSAWLLGWLLNWLGEYLTHSWLLPELLALVRSLLLNLTILLLPSKLTLLFSSPAYPLLSLLRPLHLPRLDCRVLLTSLLLLQVLPRLPLGTLRGSWVAPVSWGTHEDDWGSKLGGSRLVSWP